MKNYKIKSSEDPKALFGSKCFTEEQDKKLKEIGFSYMDIPRKYEKSYYYNKPYGVVIMVLFTGDEYIRFYNGSFILPCELEKETGSYYKTLLKIMRDDVKTLKEIQLIK